MIGLCVPGQSACSSSSKCRVNESCCQFHRHGFRLVNGPNASGVGVDATIAFRPIDRLEIGVGVSWNDLAMDEDVFSEGNRALPEPMATRVISIGTEVPGPSCSPFLGP